MWATGRPLANGPGGGVKIGSKEFAVVKESDIMGVLSESASQRRAA